MSTITFLFQLMFDYYYWHGQYAGVYKELSMLVTFEKALIGGIQATIFQTVHLLFLWWRFQPVPQRACTTKSPTIRAICD